MTLLVDILYRISNSLLIPILIALLFFFMQGLWLSGDFIANYIKRIHFIKGLNIYLENLKSDYELAFPLADFTGTHPLFQSSLTQIIKARYNSTHLEKIISDYEMQCEKKLSTTRFMVRLGPMLGLMGTLIPMGPALVALGSGDISQMASNMQVAFSTTVLGLFVGGLGYLVGHTQQRWFNEDLNTLHFLASLREEKEQR